jgi:hypothetical protein
MWTVSSHLGAVTLPSALSPTLFLAPALTLCEAGFLQSSLAHLPGMQADSRVMLKHRL